MISRLPFPLLHLTVLTELVKIRLVKWVISGFDEFSDKNVCTWTTFGVDSDRTQKRVAWGSNVI